MTGRSEAEQRAYDDGYRDCAISARAMHDRDMTWRDEENVRLHRQLKGAVGALVEIANGSRWTAIQTRAHAVARLEAMGVNPYAPRGTE
jgi:hypothetical protein